MNAYILCEQNRCIFFSCNQIIFKMMTKLKYNLSLHVHAYLYAEINGVARAVHAILVNIDAL